MRLRVKDVNLSTGGPLVVILSKEDALKLDVLALDRIKLKTRKKGIVVVVDVAEDRQILQGEIGVFEEVLDKLRIKERDFVDISLVERPKSVQYIKKKLKGGELNYREFNEIIKDIVENHLSEVEITYFVSGCYTERLSLDESVSLTKAIVENGSQLRLDKKIIVDKHCISGVPGNRTTMIIVPILAAAGLTIPKTSSRAITSASGTADTFEVLAPTSLSIKKIKQVIKKTNGCIVWGGALELASADDRLVKIERPLSLDPEGILLSSIMAKKKAVNATHVLIDIPYGKEAKILTRRKGLDLKKKFISVGRKLGIKVRVVLTKGDEPIGNGIGPALEVRDVLDVLYGNGPEDLRKKSIFLANEIFEMVGMKKNAREILDSGKALKKMVDIVKAQGGRLKRVELGKFKFDFKAEKNGRIKHISNHNVNHIARIAGAPEDKKAGIYLYVHVKSKIKKGDKLFRVYAGSREKLRFVKEALKDFRVMEIK